ncbi:uncharacterized protein PV09_04501 [Verruconis gallopava]|uniref:ARID domain-containing protein n=1 Tax=Verruconis gallopava TaxID=253628 RepID=A0A0D1YU42_9PEZI|nr:uncharacterized protein PV09_04501 [Verruconis gallopava]KIW04192.1 hypothetical protein PV09_04501 [Verruconis gallopava]
MVLKQRDPSVERTEEYEEFIKDLEQYHAKRGTVFDPQPKVGPRHVDLLKLYKKVLEEGGYDRVSDTKNNKLAWRKIAQDFMPHNVNIVQMAFLLKTAYYKNLAAYEISTYWKETPPPKEILEDISARGGDLRTRTLENYTPRVPREQENLANGEKSDGSDDETKTPKVDKMEIDDPGSQSGRATRGLRQAPPQRVLFGQQADLSQGRTTRTALHQTNSPTPGVNGSYGSSGAAMTISNYEPRTVMPATVKPAWTPASQPQHFRDLARRMLAQRRSSRPQGHIRGTPMLPGTGFTGANIYLRALFALQSGEPAEIRYALHHLVKISHERGDKYLFEQFVGLAEALLEQILKVSSLCYDINWRISYEDEPPTENDVLNALNGTPNIMQKLAALQPLPIVDGLQPEDFAMTLSNVNEAGLVLRNMVMLEQNAAYIVRRPLLRDLLVIILNLPERPALTELRHYALDIAEQITKYFALQSNDPLYTSLLAQLKSDDRGAIITALRALSRIAMNFETIPNRLADVPVNILQRVFEWLLVDDEELRSSCLDFLYQYTAITENVEYMLKNLDMEGLVGQLVRLLMYGAQVQKEKEERRTVSSTTPDTASTPPKLSPKIIETLIATIPDERELSSAWLRTCFEEDPQGEITQLALWSAYNEAFAQAKLTRPLMQAKDFITNVSSTFTNAQAQVVYPDQDRTKPKYTIRGVRPRSVPVDLRGRPYLKCLWRTPAPTTNGFTPGQTKPRDSECDFSVLKADEMWEHVMNVHFNMHKDKETGRFVLANSNGKQETNGDVIMGEADSPAPVVAKVWSCHWGGCKKMRDSSDLNAVVKHVITHLPDTSLQAPIHKVHNVSPERVEIPSSKVPYQWIVTATDERGDAAGLPLAAILVLRNLARQMGKVDEAEKVGGGRQHKWVEKCFGPVRERIAWVGAWNRSLRDLMPPLEFLVEKGLGLPTLPPLNNADMDLH